MFIMQKTFALLPILICSLSAVAASTMSKTYNRHVTATQVYEQMQEKLNHIPALANLVASYCAPLTYELTQESLKELPITRSESTVSNAIKKIQATLPSTSKQPFQGLSNPYLRDDKICFSLVLCMDRDTNPVTFGHRLDFGISASEGLHIIDGDVNIDFMELGSYHYIALLNEPFCTTTKKLDTPDGQQCEITLHDNTRIGITWYSRHIDHQLALTLKLEADRILAEYLKSHIAASTQSKACVIL